MRMPWKAIVAAGAAVALISAYVLLEPYHKRRVPALPARSTAKRAFSGMRLQSRVKEGRTTSTSPASTSATAISGVVVDPNGKPVAGASIRVSTETHRYTLKGRTDEKGRFSTRSILLGMPVFLTAVCPGHGPSEPLWLKTSAKQPIRLVLTAHLDITGRVVDESGAPVPGVRVIPRCQYPTNGTPGDGSLVEADMGQPEPVLTDEDGRFELRNPSRDDLYLTFDQQRFEPEDLCLTVPADDVSVSLKPIVLKRGESICGIVVDARGEPVGGVRVCAGWVMPSSEYSLNGVFIPRHEESVCTDDNGAFAFGGLDRGTYYLFLVSKRLVCDRPWVQSGAKRVKLIARPPGRLVGRVVNSRGSPVDFAFVQVGAKVWWGPAMYHSYTGEDPPSVGSLPISVYLGNARTEPDGTFTMDRLPTNRSFIVLVQAHGLATTLFRGVRTSQGSRTFTLAPPASLGGVAYDASGGPLCSTEVVVRSNDTGSKRVSFTGHSGEFHVGNLPAGPLTISFLQDYPAEDDQQCDSSTYSEPMPVRPNDQNVRIVLSPGLTVAGVVIGRNGMTRSDADILLSRGGVPAGSTISGAGGKFVLHDVPAGSYRVTVTPDIVRIARNSGKLASYLDDNPQRADPVYQNVKAGDTGVIVRVAW